MDSFGDRLRQAREARGVSLPDIAAKTKIAVAALEALERNDVRRLPGGIFGRAMVRSYAIAVGLDGDKTVNDFMAEIARAERDRARTVTRPEITADDRQFLERQRRAMRIVRVAALLFLVAAILLLGWYFWGRRRAAAVSPDRGSVSEAASSDAAVRPPIPIASVPGHPYTRALAPVRRRTA